MLGVLIFWPPPKLALLLVTPGLLSDAFVSLFSDEVKFYELCVLLEF